MLGLPRGKVFLVPWTEQWEQEFNNESKRIMNELGNLIFDIHHIGSTAIKYLSAKPIIDIAIELNNYNDGLLCVSGLGRLGYSYKGTDILPERHYFNKGYPRTHQIHMFHKGNEHIKKQLIFRDFLCKNEEARFEYQRIKEELSKQFQVDKFAYSDAKTEFINNILLKATRGRQ